MGEFGFYKPGSHKRNVDVRTEFNSHRLEKLRHCCFACLRPPLNLLNPSNNERELIFEQSEKLAREAGAVSRLLTLYTLILGAGSHEADDERATILPPVFLR